jgi:tetratricopeptide (TPR) repeat protein
MGRSSRTHILIRLLTLLLVVALPISSRVSAATETTSHAPGVKDEVDGLFRQAQNDFAKGNYASAAAKYERALALRPNSPEALSNLGICYHFLGRTGEAVATLEGAVRLNPSLVPANLILGIDLVKLQKPEMAIPLLRRVLRQDPTNRDALLALASAYFGLEEYEKAVEVYQSEVRARPTDADAWYGLGLCFEHIAEDTSRLLAKTGEAAAYYHRLVGEFLTEQGSGIDAEEAFRRALALAPQGMEGLRASLGFALLRLGEVPKARAEFEAELRLFPGSQAAKLGLAAAALEERDFATGVKDVCAVFDTDQDYFLSHLGFLVASLSEAAQSKASEIRAGFAVSETCQRAFELLQQELRSPQSAGGAADLFERAVGTPAHPPLANGPTIDGARDASRRGRYRECAQGLQQTPTLKVEDTLLLARCACLSGSLLVGFEAARRIVRTEPQNVAALYWQAEAARSLARAYFRRAVSLNPNSWQGHVLTGDLYRQRKQWDLAKSHYQEAARLKPDSPAPFLGLATICWETGQNQEARGQLERVLTLQPDNSLANFVLGDINVREHRFEEAIPYLQKSRSDLLTVHADLGKAFAALGKTEEAIAELTRARPMDRYGDIHYQLYRLYKKQNKTALAAQMLAESEKRRASERHLHEQRLERATELSEQTSAPHP